MDDLRDLAGDPPGDAGIEAEPVLRDVTGQHPDAAHPRLGRSERAAQRLAQPLAGVRVVASADQHVQRAVGQLQVADEQLRSDEARRACQQDAVAGGRGRLGRVAGQGRVTCGAIGDRAHAACASASSSSIAVSMPRAMRSASSASSACA